MNHNSGVQELALQYMIEEKIDLDLFSESWFVPDNNLNWFHSTCKRAVIFCNNIETRRRCRVVASSDCWSGIEFGDILIVSCYLFPND